MPNINNSIIDFNDFNAEPQLLRDIQDGKAIAFYSFAHLLLNADGTPYTMSKGVQLSGNYDTLNALKEAFPEGNSNLYIVNEDSKIYYWNGADWVVGGEINVTYASTLELESPSESTSGTLTSTQLNTLKSNTFTQIKLGNFIYRKQAVVGQTEMIYKTFTDEHISIMSVNMESGAWTIETYPVNVPWTVDDIPDEGIKLEKLKDTTYNPNQLIDKSDYIDNTYVSYYNGLETSNTDHIATNFQKIPKEVINQTIHFSTLTTHFCFYTNDKTFIEPSWSTDGVTEVVVPSNAVYWRFSIYKPYIDTFAVSLTTNFDSNGSYRILKDNALGFINGNKLTNTSVTPDKTSFFIDNPKQLVDKTDLIEGHYVSKYNGILLENAEWNATQFIYIDESFRGKTMYINSPSNHICFYTEDKSFIPATWDDNNHTSFEIPTNAAYVRFSIYKDYLKTYCVSMVAGQFDVEGNKIIIDDKYIGLSQNIITYTIGKGGDNEDFIDGIEFAYNNLTDADIYILEGEYDLSNSNVWERLTDGLHIGRGNRYHFSPNARVKCYLPSSATDRQIEYFSVFYAFKESGSFLLDGLHLEGGNMRYLVHDERGGHYNEWDRGVEQKSYYKDCTFIRHDTDSRARLSMCLGCGLGSFTDVRIENCYFETTKDWLEADDLYEGAWHGNFTSAMVEGCNSIHISNCYFKHGVIVNSPTPETKPNEVIVNNCRLGKVGIVVTELEGYGAPNYILREWNNTKEV